MIKKFYKSSTLDAMEAMVCARRLKAFLDGECEPTLNRLRQNFILDAVKGLEEGVAKYEGDATVCLTKGGLRTNFARLLEDARWITESAAFTEICPNGAVIVPVTDGDRTETCLHDALGADGRYLLPVATSSFGCGLYPWYTRGADERAARLYEMLGDDVKEVIIAGASERPPNGGVGYLRLDDRDVAIGIIHARELARAALIRERIFTEICDCDWCGFNRRPVVETLGVAASPGDSTDD